MSLRDEFALFHNVLGQFTDIKLAGMGPSMKYATEVALRVPLLFLIHQWFILSPYSEYTILEVPLFLIRLLGGIFLFGCQEAEKSNLFLIYSTLTLEVVIAWTIDLTYWMIQNEASGTCDIQAWISADSTDYWWTILISVAIIQTCYIFYLCYRYQISEKLEIKVQWVVVVYLLLHCTCSSAYFLYILSPIHFYFYKFLFQIVSSLQCLYIMAQDERLQRYVIGFRDVLPGRWIYRDVQSAFAFVYFISCVCLDAMWIGIAEVMTGHYLIGLFGKWTTSIVILLSLASFMWTVSNCAQAICRYIVTGNVNFMQVFDVNAGYPVFKFMVVTSILAGVLSGPLYNKSENMAIVLLLRMLRIVYQLWDLSAQHFLFVLHSGQEGQKWVYIRIICVMIFIVSGSICVVYCFPNTHQLDFWPFLNVIGVTRFVSSVILYVIQFIIIAVSWRITVQNDLLANAISYPRVTRSVAKIVCLALLMCYRLYSPYFEGPFFLNLLINLCEFVIVTIIILFEEAIVLFLSQF